MQHLLSALEEWNSPEVQASLLGHGTRTPAANAAFEKIEELEQLVGVYAEVWNQLAELANTDALDSDEIEDENGFVAGRSSMAHAVLLRMAAAEHKAAEL